MTDIYPLIKGKAGSSYLLSRLFLKDFNIKRLYTRFRWFSSGFSCFGVQHEHQKSVVLSEVNCHFKFQLRMVEA